MFIPIMLIENFRWIAAARLQKRRISRKDLQGRRGRKVVLINNTG
jgi:hypothetical protein